VKGRATGRGPITQSATQGYAQAMFQVNGALTTYNLGAGVTFNNAADVVTTARRVDHCLGDRVTNTTTNTKPPLANLGRLDIDFRDVPLPPTPAGVTGTRTVPRQFNGYQGQATIQWTMTPIAAR
jgi:hypothetical protein